MLNIKIIWYRLTLFCHCFTNSNSFKLKNGLIKHVPQSKNNNDMHMQSSGCIHLKEKVRLLYIVKNTLGKPDRDISSRLRAVVLIFS